MFLLRSHTAWPMAVAWLALAGCGKETAAPEVRPAPQVSVLTVKGQDIPFTPSFVAQTESSRQVNIVARVSGFLDRIAYQEGELVKEGQLLFQLDPKPFQAQLEAARGALQAQQARFATAQANLGRVKPLAEQNALSQADLDRAQGEFDAAKAAVFSAQANVTQAELNLGYATIRSPVTGLAGRALQRQGAYINSMAESRQPHLRRGDRPDLGQLQRLAEPGRALGRGRAAWARWCAPKNQDYEIDLVMPDGTPFPQKGPHQFRRPVVQPGHRLVHGARRAAQPEEGDATGHVRHRAD